MIYFTSDTHFFGSMHANRKLLFSSYSDMHKIIVDNWNSVVNNNDDIYIIGDFSNEKGYLKTTELLKNLNGNKYLIKGSNDNFLENKKFDYSLFNFIKDYHVLNFENKKIILFHYPILEWEGYHQNSILIHGHWHQDKKYNNRAFNAASDIHNFKPVSIKQILNNIN